MRTDYLAVALGAQPRAVGFGASAVGTVGGLLRFVGDHDAPPLAQACPFRDGQRASLDLGGAPPPTRRAGTLGHGWKRSPANQRGAAGPGDQSTQDAFPVSDSVGRPPATA